MIEGKKTLIKALSRNDASKILNWINNPTLKILTGTLYPVSDVEHEEWFENKLKDKTNKIFGIEDKDSSTLIGVIGFKNTDLYNRSAELYIYIGEENLWGKGLGTDSVETYLKFAFNELNLHRIYLEVFAYNDRAIRSYEKVGFLKEGLLKDSVYKEGKYHDKVLMAIINQNESS